MTREQFLVDEKTKAATVREIEIIGEACVRLPAAFKDDHSEVPWDDLVRLRNIYIHIYDRIRYNRVWTTATRSIPVIAESIRVLIPVEPAPDNADVSV